MLYIQGFPYLGHVISHITEDSHKVLYTYKFLKDVIFKVVTRSTGHPLSQNFIGKTLDFYKSERTNTYDGKFRLYRVQLLR